MTLPTLVVGVLGLGLILYVPKADRKPEPRKPVSRGTTGAPWNRRAMISKLRTVQAKHRT